MKKLSIILMLIFFASASYADIKKKQVIDLTNRILNNTSGGASSIIPGEGVTEASIQINEDDNPDLEILVVRDISASEFSNLFSQLSLHTQEINSSDRLITNLGIGYRQLSEDKSSMFGLNSFVDYDLEGHVRGSVGFEAKGAMFDVTANSYHKWTTMEVVDGTEEQVLSGYEINISSQIPYMPWATFNWQNYGWEKDEATNNTEGNMLSLETMLSPTVQFDVSGDYSDNSGVDDEYNAKLSFVYPPRDYKKTLEDGFIASTAFEKGNVEKKLKEKVRRSNNLTVEVQGSVIITSK